MARFTAGIFLRIATDPVTRFWAGVDRYSLAADPVDPTGGDYQGLGALLDIPPVQQLINGLAERITFSLSGVTPDLMRLAEQDADEVRGALVNLGFLRFDQNIQPVGRVQWKWEGEADVVQCARTAGQDLSVSRIISVSVGTMQTDRKRSSYGTYTPADQRRRSPSDAGCDYVPKYSAGSTKRWG